MRINETYKIGGYLVGIGKVHKDGTEEYKWLEEPKHNKITSVGLNHLLTLEGNDTGGYTITTDTNQIPALWLGTLNTRKGALTYCKIGTNNDDTLFTDTDLKNSITDYSDVHRTGTPYCGTKVTENGYNLRMTYVSKAVTEQSTIKEVGIFGKYRKDGNDIYPMFARVALDTPIKLESGESLTFTYQLNIELYYTTEETGKFFDVIDSNGEDLYYAKKSFFTYVTKTDKKYSDQLKNNLYINTNGHEVIYNSNSFGPETEPHAGSYFMDYGPYYYHNYNTYGGYDSIGFSTESQDYNMSNDNLSKAKKLTGDYTFEFTDYVCRNTNRKYRDIKITMGIYNPDFENPTDYLDIKFLRIRGMNYKFGYYDSNTNKWCSQSLRKWANQTMTFIVRTEFVTEDTIIEDTI